MLPIKTWSRRRLGVNWSRSSTKGVGLIRQFQFLCILFLLAADSAAGTVAVEPVFKTYGVDDGLPSGHVMTIAQDRHRYLWFGTREGLARFDGLEFRVYRHDPDDPDSIPSNSVQVLFRDSRGRLWAALEEAGLVQLDDNGRVVRRFHADSAQFALPGNNVWAIAEACDGSLWLGFLEQGLVRLWPKNGRIVHYPPITGDSAAGLPAETVLSLLVDTECRLWVGTWRRGLFRLHSQTDQFTGYRGVDGLPGLTVTALAEDGQGRIWTGARRGVTIINPDNDRLHDVPLPEQGQRTPLVTGLVLDSDDTVWVTSRIGIFKLDPRNAKSGPAGAIRFKPIAGLYGSLPTDSFWSIFRDHGGGLWFGSLGQGASFLPANWFNFQRYQRNPTDAESLSSDAVISLHYDAVDGGVLWVGTMDDGLNRIDLETHRVTQYRHDPDRPDSLARPRVRSIYRDSRNRLWIGHGDGISQLLSDGRFRHAFQDAALREIMQTGFVADQLDVGDGRLWLALYGSGLLYFDPDGGAYRHYHTAAEPRYRLTHNFVYSVAAGPDGRLWLASDGGLMALNTDGAVQALTGAPVDQVVVASFGTDGDLWLGTADGVSRYRISGTHLARIAQYSSQDGLPPATAVGLVSTDTHVWLTTQAGLAQLDPHSGAVRVFDKSDGLPSIEFEKLAVESTPDGRVFAGSTGGVIGFDSNRLAFLQQPLAAHIRGIRTPSGRNEASGGQAGRTPIEFPYDEQVITFDFGTVSFSAPQHIRYRYRLRGLDNQWVEVQGVRERSYSRLRPGRYTFDVQATGRWGDWNTPVVSAAIRILPPVWRTPGAFALYLATAFLILLASYSGYRSRRRRLHQLRLAQERQEFAEVQRQVTRRLTETVALEEIIRRYAETVLDQTSADGIWFCFVADNLPDDLLRTGDDAPELPGRDWFQTHLASVDPADPTQDFPIRHSGGRHGSRVFHGIPLAARGTLLGLAVLHKTGSQPFDAHERTLARLYGKVAGAAIENARLFERLKHSAAKADQASAAKSDFLATMSHEIRTPLNGILGMAELLDETRLNAEQRSLLRSLRSSGTNLLRVLNEVLDLSKAESGRLELETAEFSLCQLVERTVNLFAGSAADKGLELSAVIRPAVPDTLIGDAGHLEQVLNNLTGNAVKFTERGSVDIRIDRAGDGRIVFSVQDSGIGMTPEQTRRLFKAFSQADQSTSRRYGGSGLGLAISQRIVEAMGGRIEVQSGIGGGSRFFFSLTLPAVADRDVRRLLDCELVRRKGVIVVAGDAVAESVACYLDRWRIPCRVRPALTAGDSGCASDIGIDGQTDTLIVDMNQLECVRNSAALTAGCEVLVLMPYGAEFDDDRGFGVVRKPVTYSRLATALMTIALKSAQKAAG